jgi:hypothetical protein
MTAKTEDVLVLAGVSTVAVGIGLWSIPASLIFVGTSLTLAGVMWDRITAKPAPPAKPETEEL